MRMRSYNEADAVCGTVECQQGRIEPPKAARGHATSHSPCIDGIVLSVTKNNISG